MRNRPVPAALTSRGLQITLLALLALAPVALSQSPAIPAATNLAAANSTTGNPHSAPPSTLQSNVSEVSLDLIVRDKKNRLVPDLSLADFAVTDSGAPVKISSLRLAELTPASPRMITLVFDRLDPARSKNAHAIADKLIKAIPGQGFRFAVMCADGRLRLIQQYTGDRASIERAVALVTEGSAADLTAESSKAEATLTADASLPGAPPSPPSSISVSVAEREAARMTYKALAASQQMVAGQQTPPPLAALMAIAQAECQYPGRKVMVYFTGGLEADSRINETIKTASGEANRAGVSLYAIDMSAIRFEANENLMVTAAIGAAMTSSHLNPPPAASAASPGDTTPIGIRIQAHENTTNLEMNDLQAGSSPLVRLADATGGRYIPAEMNMNKQLHQMAEELTTFYVATYTPPIGDYDGTFRAIAVKPLRKNIGIRARSGYFALPPSDTAGLRPFEMPLLELLKESQRPTDFRFAARIVDLGGLPTGLTQELVVEAPIGELEMRKDTNSGLFSLHANLLAQITDESGTVVEQFGQELRRHGALDTADAARSEVLSFQSAFVAAPGKYTLKIAMADAIGGKVSVQQSSFELAGVKPGPSLSDLVLVRRVEPAPAGRETEVALGDPFHSANGDVISNLAGVVPDGAKEVSLFFIIHPGPAALGKPAMEITVSRNGHPVGHAPLALREAADNSPVPYFSTLGTRSMSPGEYLVTVRFAQGGQSFERSVPLRIQDQTGARAELASATGAANPHGGPAATADDLSEPPDYASAELPPLVVIPGGPGAPTESAADVEQKIEQVRALALDYAAKLPNFLCLETTSRSVDPSGQAKWKHQDTFSEVLAYRNRQETRQLVEINGHTAKQDPGEIKGMVSHGEFGGILNAIFDPSAHAAFVWKESGLVGGERVDIFDYRVASKDSTFSLTGDNNWQYSTAFHGVVSVDSATHGVRQLTLIADRLPADFSIRASAVRVDYEYIAINGHDYLLPTRATISLKRHKHEGVLNEIEFRDYRRFSARSRMVAVAQ